MIDHLVLTVRNLSQSATFYQRSLEPLGHSQRAEGGAQLDVW